MMRRTTESEIFPNVLGRQSVCVATVDYTSLVCLVSFLHLSEDECVDQARREPFTVSSQTHISVGILDDLITPRPVYCFAVHCDIV